MGSLKKAATKLLAVAMIHSRTLASSPITLPNLHIYNKTPYCTSSLNSILRPPPRLTYAPPLISAVSNTMSTEATNRSSSDTVIDHDALLKQKRILRNKVKSDLKSMDPAQRAQEGSIFLHFLIIIAMYCTQVEIGLFVFN